MISDNTGFLGNNYLSGWINEGTSNFVDANASNTIYGVSKDAYAGTTVRIDTNNNGNDFCSNIYGTGWRLATSYEMGINIDSVDVNNEYGFIPAYLGEASGTDIAILSSTLFNTNKHWIVGSTSGVSTDLINTGLKTKCVYAIY